MGQKCRKYRKARKNRIIKAPGKQQEEDKALQAFQPKCKKNRSR